MGKVRKFLQEPKAHADPSQHVHSQTSFLDCSECVATLSCCTDAGNGHQLLLDKVSLPVQAPVLVPNLAVKPDPLSDAMPLLLG